MPYIRYVFHYYLCGGVMEVGWGHLLDWGHIYSESLGSFYHKIDFTRNNSHGSSGNPSACFHILDYAFYHANSVFRILPTTTLTTGPYKTQRHTMAQWHCSAVVYR